MKIIFTGSQFEKPTEPLNIPDDQLVMLIDMDRCIRCGTCQLACGMEHGKEGKPGAVRTLHAENGQNSPPNIFTLPGGCRVCQTPCMYYDINNFWIRCPDEKIQARALEPSCDLCLERRQKGLWPACATRCPMKTIYVDTMAEIRIVMRDKRFRKYGDVVISGQASLP